MDGFNELVLLQNVKKHSDNIKKIRDNKYELNEGLLYHYRTLEGFWNIIESESFWATNAQFCNDQEEQEIGIKNLKNTLDMNKKLNEDILIDRFTKLRQEISIIKKTRSPDIASACDEFTKKLSEIMSPDSFNKIDKALVYTNCKELFDQLKQLNESKLDIDTETLKTKINEIELTPLTKIDFIDMEEYLDDCYIICFCNSDDKLSQWRAYADGGVSIGLEMHNIRQYQIQKIKAEEEPVKCYNACLPVRYIKRNDTLNFISAITEEIDLFKKLSLKAIPYLKHIGFCEEEEYRLSFINKKKEGDMQFDLSECIHYREKDVKIPYIISSFKEKFDNNDNNVLICGEKSNEMKLFLQTEIENEDLNFNDCFDSCGCDDSICKNCINREFPSGVFKISYTSETDEKSPYRKCNYTHDKEQFYVRKKLEPKDTRLNNTITLPNVENQEEIYELLHNLVELWNKSHSQEEQYKVWCKGHLPVRTITIGPCRNQREILNSIRHYCNEHYWLRDVIVRCSETPYRKALK